MNWMSAPERTFRESQLCLSARDEGKGGQTDLLGAAGTSRTVALRRIRLSARLQSGCARLRRTLLWDREQTPSLERFGQEVEHGAGSDKQRV